MSHMPVTLSFIYIFNLSLFLYTSVRMLRTDLSSSSLVLEWAVSNLMLSPVIVLNSLLYVWVLGLQLYFFGDPLAPYHNPNGNACCSTQIYPTQLHEPKQNP